MTAFADLSARHLISGRLVRAEGKTGHDVLDPATVDRIGEIVDGTTAEVERAVEIANDAHQQWRKTNYHKRSELLHEASHAMKQARPLVAEMLTRETGKPYKESADEVLWSATATDYYAEVFRHEAGRVLGPLVNGQFNDQSPGAPYAYWAGFNPAALVALAAGCGVYVYLLNPLSYVSHGPYRLLTASLPAAAAAAITFALVTRFFVARAGRGGYR